jgi:hypothetical protein
MAKSVYRVDSFSITRGSGLGKQDATALSVHFPASTDRSSTLPRWTAWLTQRKHNKLGGEDILKARHGKLTLFVWTGTTMDHTAGNFSSFLPSPPSPLSLPLPSSPPRFLPFFTPLSILRLPLSPLFSHATRCLDRR